jgi:predicted pyridoxine 5'-phosphate oxidase superfamily flavin-nucleotide-binding protein
LVTGAGAAQTAVPGDLKLCFEGAIPAVVATATADGTPNITYLSRVRRVDDERIALSNQFFSKTSRNLAENPRASVLLVDPVSYRQYRLKLAYERTERRGRVFELLHEDVAAVAAMQGMQGVFKLRGADIYRVLHIEVVPGAVAEEPEPARPEPASAGVTTGLLAELSSRLGRCPDLDTLVAATVDGLAELFGYGHSLLLLLDEEGAQLYTIASRGYEAEGVGSEVRVWARVSSAWLRPAAPRSASATCAR